jgi:hypothetical protein
MIEPERLNEKTETVIGAKMPHAVDKRVAHPWVLMHGPARGHRELAGRRMPPDALELSINPWVAVLSPLGTVNDRVSDRCIHLPRQTLPRQTRLTWRSMARSIGVSH